MFEIPDMDLRTTDGEIALINLESVRQRAWSRFHQDAMREGIAESIAECEQLTAQFVGDVSALDRLETLAERLGQVDGGSARTALVQAQVASTLHRFADAKQHLAQAKLGGARPGDVQRLEMTIDQACGLSLDGVLEERRKIADKYNRLDDLIALGALLADLRDFVGAEFAYHQALRVYSDVSPFPVAWVCFQLGLLWGELVPEPDTDRAAHWYRKAVDSLPKYVAARLHLAEICASSGRPGEAEALLMPAAATGDPVVYWRLADVLAAQGRVNEAHMQMQAARSAFESLLEKHLLAFANHGAEFYAGSGGNFDRALELARVNVANRPTLRAYEQAHAIAVSGGDESSAAELFAAATERWGRTAAFQASPLAKPEIETWKGAAA
jgi:tetratricopeptide (TPR) repeat protein